ncbi:MAG: sugar phosphate isomerase/epimerase, partial [Phycisphaerales bacterium]|nr:sugar phosphate isomerase/epimerase [Phycisphaerales bacterium]
MLLTLSAGAFRGRIDSEKDSLTLFDLPAFTITELGLRGLGINASQLVGMGMAELERIRDYADKASCPVLLLNEDAPLEFGSPSPKVQDEVLERIRRLGVATSALGASCLGVACGGMDTDETFDQAAATIRRAMQAIDRHEVNLLL